MINRKNNAPPFPFRPTFALGRAPWISQEQEALSKAIAAPSQPTKAMPMDNISTAVVVLPVRDVTLQSSSPDHSADQEPVSPEARTASMGIFAGLVRDVGTTAIEAANDAEQSASFGASGNVEPPADADANLVNAYVVPAETDSVREKTELRRIVASRLLRARELSGMAQTEAALKFGYKTPAQLSLWEQNRRMPPLLELIRASEIYAVTTDFLLGLSDDEVQDKAEATRHACINAVRAQLEAVASLTVDAVAQHSHEVGPQTASFERLTIAGEHMLDAARAFCRLNNKKFDDMAGGATLLRRAEELEAELFEARVTIRQCAAQQAKLMNLAASLGSTATSALRADSQNGKDAPA